MPKHPLPQPEESTRTEVSRTDKALLDLRSAFILSAAGGNAWLYVHHWTLGVACTCGLTAMVALKQIIK
jgi:hypothetical protein